MESPWLEHSLVLRNPKHCGLRRACQGEQGVLSLARLGAGKMEEALLGHPAQEQGALPGAFCYPAPENGAPDLDICIPLPPAPTPQSPTPRRKVPHSFEDQPAFLGLHPLPLNLGRKLGSDLFPRPGGVGSLLLPLHCFLYPHTWHLLPLHVTSLFVLVARQLLPCTKM